MNEFYAKQKQQQNSIGINQSVQAFNNRENNKESSYLKEYPVRKLDFNGSNNKFNSANLKSSENKNFKRNDLNDFSNFGFNSCKSKIE